MTRSNINIFNYTDYRSALNKMIDNAPYNGRGIKSTIAYLIECRPSYITHVLSGRLNFTLEQAIVVTKYFELNANETNFFLALLNYDRAGNSDLKKHYQSQLALLKELSKSTGQSVIDNPDPERLEYEEVRELSSSWIYTALIVKIASNAGTSICKLQNDLQIKKEIISDAIKLLIRRGYVIKDGDSLFKSNKNVSFVCKEIIAHRNMHITWRSKVLHDLQQLKDRDGLNITFPIATNYKLKNKCVDILKDAISEIKNLMNNDTSQRSDESCDDNENYDETFVINIDMAKF